MDTQKPGHFCMKFVSLIAVRKMNFLLVSFRKLLVLFKVRSILRIWLREKKERTPQRSILVFSEKLKLIKFFRGQLEERLGGFHQCLIPPLYVSILGNIVHFKRVDLSLKLSKESKFLHRNSLSLGTFFIGSVEKRYPFDLSVTLTGIMNIGFQGIIMMCQIAEVS